MKRLLVLVAMVPVLLADTCGDQNACDHPPPGVGAVVTDVQAVADPEYRRLGLARQLLTEVIRTGREAGARRIALQTEDDNLPALLLCELCDFQGCMRGAA